MMGVTRKQAELLTFLESYMTDNRVAPSFEEMKLAIGVQSKSAVHGLLTKLEERGLIRRRAKRTRAIELVKPDDLARILSAELVDELERRGYHIHCVPPLLRKAA